MVKEWATMRWKVLVGFYRLLHKWITAILAVTGALDFCKDYISVSWIERIPRVPAMLKLIPFPWYVWIFLACAVCFWGMVEYAVGLNKRIDDLTGDSLLYTFKEYLRKRIKEGKKIKTRAELNLRADKVCTDLQEFLVQTSKVLEVTASFKGENDLKDAIKKYCDVLELFRDTTIVKELRKGVVVEE